MHLSRQHISTVSAAQAMFPKAFATDVLASSIGLCALDLELKAPSMGLAQGIVIVAQFLLLVTQAPWEGSCMGHGLMVLTCSLQGHEIPRHTEEDVVISKHPTASQENQLECVCMFNSTT